MKKAQLGLYILFLCMFSACSFAPTYHRPKVILPKMKAKDIGTNSKLSSWWIKFQDRRLNCLIKRALKNNDNLLITYEKIEELRAKYNLASSSLYPSLNADAKFYRTRTKEDSCEAEIFNDFSLLANFSYNLDLFGRLRNQKKAAIARFLAQKDYARAVKINLISEVAITYFKLCETNKKIKILHRIINQSLKAIVYRKKEYKNGIINKVIIQRERLELDRARLNLESLIEQKDILSDRLSLLLGKQPKDIFNSRYDFAVLPKPVSLPAFLPSKVLERRPDILQAQQMLRAANFDIGVARALYFPDISLTGVFGFESRQLANLVKHCSSFWNIGGEVNCPIFEFGRIKSNVNVTISKKKQAVFSYIKTVKNAFKEIHDALLLLASIKRQMKIQKEQLASYKDILNMVKKQYKNGLVSYIQVIYAQRDIEYALMKLVSLRSKYLSQEVLLYKVLGGGW